MNEKQGFGFAQDEVVAFVVFGNQPFESRQVVIKFRPQTFEYGFDERAIPAKVSSVKRMILSRIAGSVMTVKLTSWRLLAVGARWAASRIRSIASCGTGRSESARFERRALQRSSTCSGEGSPLRSIGWILSGENELWRTEPVGQTAAQCAQTDRVAGFGLSHDPGRANLDAFSASDAAGGVDIDLYVHKFCQSIVCLLPM